MQIHLNSSVLSNLHGQYPSFAFKPAFTFSTISLLKAINAILDNGGVVKKAFVVVDREEGAMETFANEGIVLEPLISVSEFFE